MGVVGQRHAPAGLLPGMTTYPLCRALDGAVGRSELNSVYWQLYLKFIESLPTWQTKLLQHSTC